MLQNHRIVSLLAVFALIALWGVGLFARGWWRPDEPREAALVQSIADHPEHLLPELGGRPFAEKPTLTYRVAAQSVKALGMSPAASRLPQLLYALLACGSIMLLTRAMAGNGAALLGGLSFATFTLVYQTQIWLACDALTIAGVCLSLLGSYRGLTALESSPRLQGYLLMHAGLTLAFFGKNFAAWLVPLSTYIVFLLWQRRLRALLRWELWAGALIPVTCIGIWIWQIVATPDGMQTLRVLFWHNLVGRAIPVAAEARYAYTGAHHNSPGKYFIELPLYLLPWTAVAWFAARRAWKAVRTDSPEREAWRFAVCAVLPGLVILSLSATARGIYAAPSLAGFALLIALWSVDPQAQASPGARHAVTLTRGLIATLAAIVFLGTLVLQVSALRFSALGVIGSLICMGVLLTVLQTPSAPASGPAPALNRLGLAYALLLSLGVLPLYATVNRWQDLSEVAAGTEAARSRGPLVLWRPDETTLAWVDLYLKTKPQRVFYGDQAPSAGFEPLLSYLQTTPQAQVLALADKKRWTLSRWMQFLRTDVTQPAASASTDLGPFAGRTDFSVDYSYEAPGGRRYVLMSHRSP